MREQLEQNILDNPHDDAPRLIYADWLEEQGDQADVDRAEFIRTQISLEDESLDQKQRSALKRREKKLLKKYEREWMGGLAPLFFEDNKQTYEDSRNVKYEFRRGFLDKLWIYEFRYPHAKILCETPEAKWIYDFTASSFDYEAEERPLDSADKKQLGKLDPYEWALHKLVEAPFLANVRRVRLGEEWEAQDYKHYDPGNCRLQSTVVPELVAQMPRVEELYLHCGRYDLEKLMGLRTFSNLKVLKIDHVCFSERTTYEYNLDFLVKNPTLKSLTTLGFHPHGSDFLDHPDFESGGEEVFSYLPFREVKKLLDPTVFPRLTHLQIRLSNMGDAGCQAIVNSGMLKQLKVLDLRHGEITDGGAEIFAACPDFANLERLEIQRNALTNKGIKLLKATGVKIGAQDQLEEHELEDGEYLYEGDCE